MDIGKNFTFITEDEAWIKKVLIGGASMLLLSLPLLGYIKKMFKNVQEGQERPLPEWDDFMAYLVDGLKVMVVMIGYIAPVFVLYIGAAILNIVASTSGIDALSYAGLGCMCLALPLGIVLGLAQNIGVMRYFATDSFGEAFNFGAVLGFLKANIGQYLLAFVVFIAAVIAAEIVGLLACGFGIFFTMPYALMVGWKCFADVYRDAGQQQEAQF